MRRSGIVRLNLIKILRAASNACLNLLEISLLRQIYSPAAPVNFTRLHVFCLAAVFLRRAPGFKNRVRSLEISRRDLRTAKIQLRQPPPRAFLNFAARLANGL